MSQNSQENACIRLSVLIKLQAEAENVAQVNFVKFLRTRFLQNTSG